MSSRSITAGAGRGGLASTLWGSAHPGPTLVVTTLALALGLSARITPARLGILVLAVFCGQLSVGLSNDALDAGRDRAAGRVDKPLARGAVSVHEVWLAATVMLLASLGFSALLGWKLLAAHGLALTLAWGYNAGLKSTAVSVVPFVVSFAVLPSLATLASSGPGLAPPWAWAAGAALGTAVHFTNVLADLDDDARTGVRGLPHRLGAHTSTMISFLATIGGAAAVLAGSLVETAPDRVFAGSAFAAVMLIAVCGFLRALRHPDRVAFRLVMLAALLLVAQLAASGIMAS